MARADVSPQVFSCTSATDKVSAVKSITALMLACSFPTSSVNSPHAGHERTRSCATKPAPGVQRSRPSSWKRHESCHTASRSCPAVGLLQPTQHTWEGGDRAGCRPAASPARTANLAGGHTGLAVPLQHPQPLVHLPPLGYSSTWRGLRDRLLVMSRRCRVRLLVMKPKEIR